MNITNCNLEANFQDFLNLILNKYKNENFCSINFNCKYLKLAVIIHALDKRMALFVFHKTTRSFRGKSQTEHSELFTKYSDEKKALETADGVSIRL